ncbi:signal peptidase I [Tepiditoga spiralis]|uniref:Signal peptidase I n=1 Tax=Tepiditoga spiralis TaxID=2108365 RepID=A0A7G1G2Y0_9BACT|nr:signal peptidase I [Tepiditoga spiralis]BBE30681.1 signal peptidase I [Tepiditoga spiralis]
MKENIEKKIKHETLDWLSAIIYAVIFGTIIRLFVFETMMVPTVSMVPTIEVGDRMFIEKVTYNYTKPKRGDIISFWTPFIDKSSQKKLRAFDKFMDFFAPKEFNGHVKYVKRLVGLPGDTIRLVPVKESFWKDLESGNLKEVPPWLDFIIKYYGEIKYVPDLIKSKVSQLEVNGKIPKGFENRYYLINAIFENENFYKYLAYPEKLKEEIYSSNVYFFYKGNFDNKLYIGKLNINFYKQQNNDNDYTTWYEKLIKNVDLSKAIFRDKDNYINIKIPKGYCFFMGDNTLESYDSRFFGLVPEKNIIGTPFLRIWPMKRFGTIK